MAIAKSSTSSFCPLLLNPILLHLTFLFSHASYFFFLPVSSYSGTLDDFVYGGCSHQKYYPGSPYESNLDSLLTSIVNSAAFSSYSNFTAAGASPMDAIYGMYQCRGDLPELDCAACVSHAVIRTRALCPGTCGAAAQLEGCYVKYDNSTFLGVEDKTVVLKKCGIPVGYETPAMDRRDAVLVSLASTAGGYRVVGVSSEVQGVAQCTGDLSIGECQDCVSEAVERLKVDCGAAADGKIYLTKCYAKYSITDGAVGTDYRPPHIQDDESNDEGEKSFAIFIGVVAGTALLIIFIAFLRKAFNESDGK